MYSSYTPAKAVLHINPAELWKQCNLTRFYGPLIKFGRSKPVIDIYTGRKNVFARVRRHTDFFLKTKPIY